MLRIIGREARNREHKALRAMFEARKRVFVDLLNWDLPVLAGRYEVDQFDDGNAVYIIVTDEDACHLASARLLATTRPALLDSLYPELVDGPVPRGPEVLEITRFCLSPGIGARIRRRARDALLVGLAQYALDHGIGSYTGVAEVSWFEQIRRFGWNCRSLGAARGEGGRLLCALRIEIDDTTIPRLALNGISADAQPRPLSAQAA